MTWKSYVVPRRIHSRSSVRDDSRYYICNGYNFVTGRRFVFCVLFTQTSTVLRPFYGESYGIVHTEQLETIFFCLSLSLSLAFSFFPLSFLQLFHPTEIQCDRYPIPSSSEIETDVISMSPIFDVVRGEQNGSYSARRVFHVMRPKRKGENKIAWESRACSRVSNIEHLSS